MNDATQERVRAAVAALDRTAPPPAAAEAILARAMRRRAWPLVATAALAALVALGIAWTRRAPLPSPVVEELALDHLHYERNADAATVRGDAATIASWFAAKLGFTPHLTMIEAASIEGAKPCRIAGKWTALVWLDRAGHWLSLFTMPEQPTRRGCARAQGVRVCAAPDPQGGARVLVGDLPEVEMLRLIDESLR